MKCSQCSNNAIFAVGSERVPLCLQCNALFQQTLQRNNEMLREEMNYIQDSVDAMFGFSTGARYPVKRPVIVSGGTVNNNHISINNSQIGILNTGNVAHLNQTIDNLYNASQKELADNLKQFSQTVLNDKTFEAQQKDEILESLDVITNELFQKPENRKKTLVKGMFDRIATLAAISADALTVWQSLHPLLQNFFK